MIIQNLNDILLVVERVDPHACSLRVPFRQPVSVFGIEHWSPRGSHLLEPRM